jgi:hypothetical protein
MKKLLFITVALCMCIVAFSQETEVMKAKPKYEVKLNLTNTLALFPEISFEHSLKDDLGIGMSLAVSLNGGPYNLQLTPYFRIYFGNKPTKAFFIEANAAFVTFEKDIYEYYDDWPYSSYKSENAVDFGLGLAVGYKLFNKKGFTGEIYTGLGRTFENRIYPRVGISLGKQF